MLPGRAFYNETIKSAVAAFGSLFSDITIQRRDGKIIPLPISYGPRSKWLEAQKGLQAKNEAFEKLLPRASFELVAMQYDVNRKLTNKQTFTKTPSTFNDIQRTAVPVPYNLNFSLYIQTKTLNDGWQIVEQILPYFTPAYTVSVRHFPVDRNPNTSVPTNTYDMPISLEALTWSDDWTGDVGEKRVIEWSLEFQAKVNLHGAVSNKVNVIYDSRVFISNAPIDRDIYSLSRSDSDLLGLESGYAVFADSDATPVYDSDGLQQNWDVTNHIDSDNGYIIKIVRDINL